MTDDRPVKKTEPILLKFILWTITGLCMAAGALAAYWIVHIYMDYHGNKSVTFYIGGLFVGYYVAAPLWWAYRKKYPKPENEG